MTIATTECNILTVFPKKPIKSFLPSIPLDVPNNIFSPEGSIVPSDLSK